jgi:hypothetical protein
MEEFPWKQESKPEELTPEEEYESLKLTPEGRYKILKDNRFFEKRVLELCSDEEKKEIEDLKNKLGWEKLPYDNLKKFLDWVHYPENVSEESKKLLNLIGEKVYKELLDIKESYSDYLLNLDIERLKHLLKIKT